MKKIAFACLVGALTLAATPAARAYITTSGGLSFNTGTPTPTLTITSPITLKITGTGFATSLIIRGWVTGDGTQNQVTTNPSGQMLSFSLGNYSGGVPGVSLIDNLDSANPQRHRQQRHLELSDLRQLWGHVDDSCPKLDLQP